MTTEARDLVAELDGMIPAGLDDVLRYEATCRQIEAEREMAEEVFQAMCRALLREMEGLTP